MTIARGWTYLDRSFPGCNMHPVCYGAGSCKTWTGTYRTGLIAFMGTAETLDFDILGALARKAQEGDGAAYESLLEQLYSFVRRILIARLGYVSELDDLTQTCLLAIHHALPSYHPSRNIRPWIQAIVRYKIADYFRAQARRREFAQTDEILELAHQAAEHEDHVLADQVNMLELLKQLPGSLAAAVQLTKFDGLSCEAAAKQEGISAAALRKRISRAYKQLASLIEKELES